MLNEGHIRQKTSVILADYWKLNKFSCFEKGHETFGSPFSAQSNGFIFSETAVELVVYTYAVVVDL